MIIRQLLSTIPSLTGLSKGGNPLCSAMELMVRKDIISFYVECHRKSTSLLIACMVYGVPQSISFTLESCLAMEKSLKPSGNRCSHCAMRSYFTDKGAHHTGNILDVRYWSNTFSDTSLLALALHLTEKVFPLCGS